MDSFISSPIASSACTSSVSPMQKVVLIIDENEAFVHALRQELSARGFRVLTAHSPQEACFAVGHKPNLILCDIHLAVQYGINALKQIRLRLFSKNTKIILLSLHGNLYDTRYALKIGADDCLPKTMSFDALISALEHRLQQ